VITPRRTRLVRVPDLQAFRRVVRLLAESGDVESRFVIVPNRAAAREIAGPVRQLFLTRDELYERLHGRMAAPPRWLTPFDREAIAQSAAAEAARIVGKLTFQVRPGLVAEMIRFYDQLRRQSQQVGRFEELIQQTLGADAAAIDRGTERMLRQTRFLACAFAAYETRVIATGGCDEHQLRSQLILQGVARPIRHVVLTTADWIADPDGLYVADFDLLTRLPGVEAIDVVSTAAQLESGFHQRLHDWLPGIEEADGRELTGDSCSRRPTLVVPQGASPDQPWFVYRDREEELLAVARARHECERRIGVVYKRPLPYLYLAPAVLGAAGIRYASSDALPLAAEPTAAAVDLTLDAVETSFAREPLVALLRSPHFNFALDGSGIPASAIGSLNRFLSKQRYLGDRLKLEALTASADVGSALRLAVAIVRELAPMAEAAPASIQLLRLRTFLTTWLRPLADEDTDPVAARERRAREAVLDVLNHLAGAHASHHDPQWTIADLASAVRRWIQEKTFAGEEDGAGDVRLLDDQAARYTECDELFLVGLVENEWPERHKRNIFYPPALLKALGWPSEKDRRAAADAALLDLVASATQTVALSTFTLDDEALVTRSILLDEIPRARLLTAPYTPDLKVGPTSDGERNVGPTFRSGERDRSGTNQWLAMRQARPPQDLPEFHGRTGVQEPRPWSVSALETYLECPFKFFARHRLSLEEEPEDEEVMDPRQQGQLVHAVFEAFFTEWQAAGHGAIAPRDLDSAREMFVAVVDRMLQPIPPAEAALERTRLLGSPAASGLGEAVFRMEAERPIGVVERLLEYRLDGDLTLSAPDGSRVVALRGKADRIDLLADGTFRLIDYKLGWPPDRGRALQLPIYALSAERHLQHYRGRCWTLGEAAYLAFKGPKRVVPLFASSMQREEVLANAQQRVVETIEAIERGDFPPAPDDVFRCETCAFASVCRKDHVAS
jgi:RecB family exonuclease